MGTMRLSRICCLFFGSTVAALSSSAEAQLTQNFGNQPTRANFQTPTKAPSRVHRQANHAQELDGLKARYPFGQSQVFQNTPAPKQVPQPSIQQRADQLLQIEHSQIDTNANALLRNGSPFPRRQRAANIGYRRLQDDPFADQPAQDDPFGEGQVKQIEPPAPAQKQFDPFGDSPIQERQPIQKPRTFDDEQAERQQGQDVVPAQTDPFADPPGNVTPERPQLNDPNLGQPEDVEAPPRPEPQQIPGSDVRPPALVPESVIMKPLEYHQGAPLTEPFIPPTNVYQAPPVNRQPLNAQPGYAQPGYAQPGYAPQYSQPRMHPPVMVAPSYQPPYQPIPGIQQPHPGIQPDYVVPSQSNFGSTTAPLAASTTSVYSNVVDQSGNECQSCNECKSCDSCCPNFYISLYGGISDLSDLEGLGQVQLDIDNGEGFGIALGRRNGRNLRTEAEFSYRQNEFNGQYPNNPQPPEPFSGRLQSYSGMTNAYWEFIDVPTRCFKPYVGVGIGFVSIDIEANDRFGRSLIPTATDNDTSLAYQWIAGVNYKAYRNVDLFAEYRYLKADSYRIDSNIPGLTGRYNYDSENIFLGMRWKF